MFHPAKPYNDLPPLPPRQDVETRAVLKLCIEARAALAELKQSGELIPNQAVLINTLPLLEAQASSEIENIVTTTDRLFRFAGHEGSRDLDPPTREALRYRTALNHAYRSLAQRPLSTRTATEICSIIKAVEVDVRRVPGVVLVNDASGEVVYMPPEGEERLRTLLGNWENFLHADDGLDPLIKMAVMHYQFEAIHPFTDGNGRTGRVLNVVYLIEAQLLSIPVLYLSRYIIRNRSDYYRLLREVTSSGDWVEWISYMLLGVLDTARWTSTKIRTIRAQINLAAQTIKLRAPTLYSRELVDVIFQQPYGRIGNIVGAGIAKRQTASSYLRRLAAAGILKEVQIGRDKIFLHPALIEVLTTERDQPVPYAAI